MSMKNLINDHMNLNKIKRILIVESIAELNNISQPCYFPKLKKVLYELLRYGNIRESDLKKAVKNYWKNTTAKTWNLENDDYTNLLILFMYIFLQKKDKEAFESTMLFYMIRQYGNVLYRYLPNYCDENVFRYTLDNLTRSHIFYVKDTIGSAVYYFSQEMIKHWKKELTSYNHPMEISKFIRASRHRLAQSVRSFANSYYKNKEQGLGINQDDESLGVEDTLRSSKLIDDLSNEITIYKNFNKNSFNVAQKYTKINRVTGEKIVKELMNPKYKDEVKLCYEYFLKEFKMTTVDILCGNKFFIIFRRLLSNRQTKNVNFKNESKKLLETIIKNIKMEKEYNKFSNQTKLMFLNFLCLYIILILRFKICEH